MSTQNKSFGIIEDKTNHIIVVNPTSWMRLLVGFRYTNSTMLYYTMLYDAKNGRVT